MCLCDHDSEGFGNLDSIFCPLSGDEVDGMMDYITDTILELAVCIKKTKSSANYSLNSDGQWVT